MTSHPVKDQASLFDDPQHEVARSEPNRPVVVALLTGSNSELSTQVDASRSDVLEAIASGAVDIVIGTHALIQEGVDFANLGAAVIDEQHRFGVHQRISLKAKAGEQDPDLLIMTATPIPRTLSMTLYGDLDVSLLDEMPPGRMPVVTTEMSKDAMGPVYELIRSEAAAGRQTFVVCPLVEESDKIEAVSATAEHARLAKVFSDLRVGLLHGQMKPAEKESVMDAMRAGEIDVLVATTVIEVGIDIANATVMVIEDAERFGLSQLHQLRGRVGRGEHASYCVLLADPTTDEGIARIAAMVETTDGFRLAEEDLRIRGQGTVFEARQAGAADLRIADLLRDLDILVDARREAFAMVGDRLELDDEVGREVEAILGDRKDWLFVS
jgi:ATP-dependent DNA helicase RecG